MVRKNFVIDDKLYGKFKKICDVGWYKGVYSDSISEAIQLWLDDKKKKSKSK